MNDQPLESKAAPVYAGEFCKRYSRLEAHAIGLGAIAVASGLDCLLGLQTLDKGAIALYTGAAYDLFRCPCRE